AVAVLSRTTRQSHMASLYHQVVVGGRYVDMPMLDWRAVRKVSGVERPCAPQDVRQHTRRLGWQVDHYEYRRRQVLRQGTYQVPERLNPTGRSPHHDNIMSRHLFSSQW